MLGTHLAKEPSPMSSTDITPRKIFLVEDHHLLLSAMTAMIGSMEQFKVTGSSYCFTGVVDQIIDMTPDLVISDLDLPDGNGLDIVKDLRARGSDVKILIYSANDEREYALRAMNAGANGYLMKDASIPRLFECMETILAGQASVSESIFDTMLGNAPSETSKLTDRELAIFTRIGQGATNNDIAERLHISLRTVDSHRTNMRRKLGLRNAGDLVREAVLWVEGTKGSRRSPP